ATQQPSNPQVTRQKTKRLRGCAHPGERRKMRAPLPMARYEERDDSYDLLNHYLQEIAKVPRLTPEREKELGRRVQENDKAALEELVKANLRFVVSYAKRYRNTHVHFLDLIKIGRAHV